jgi:CRP-like cAMP-binding protein
MAGDDRVAVMAGMAMFSDLSQAEVAAAAEAFEEQVFGAGTRLLRKGFSGTSFFVVADGQADVVVDGERLLSLQRGDFFGELSVILGEPATADVVAVGQVRCLMLPGAAFEQFMVSHPRVMYRLLRAQSQRLRDPFRWKA